VWAGSISCPYAKPVCKAAAHNPTTPQLPHPCPSPGEKECWVKGEETLALVPFLLGPYPLWAHVCPSVKQEE